MLYSSIAPLRNLHMEDADFRALALLHRHGILILHNTCSLKEGEDIYSLTLKTVLIFSIGGRSLKCKWL
jgi:hypothetical protein